MATLPLFSQAALAAFSSHSKPHCPMALLINFESGSRYKKARNTLQFWKGSLSADLAVRTAANIPVVRTVLDSALALQNLFNVNYGTVSEQQYAYGVANGGTWLNPTTILGPRFVRLNFTFNF